MNEPYDRHRCAKYTLHGHAYCIASITSTYIWIQTYILITMHSPYVAADESYLSAERDISIIMDRLITRWPTHQPHDCQTGERVRQEKGLDSVSVPIVCTCTCSSRFSASYPSRILVDMLVAEKLNDRVHSANPTSPTNFGRLWVNESGGYGSARGL